MREKPPVPISEQAGDGDPERSSSRQAWAAPLREGDVLSHYRITGTLGQGGMGVVYRAVDLNLDRAAALKLLPPGRVADDNHKRRFLQEAKTASSLNHPSIVTVYEIGSHGGTEFIAMECVEGRGLDDLIAGRSLSLKEVLKYGTQIADALAAAHAAGIVHRDLKPANIMVTARGLVKVLDFGLAKLSPEFVSREAAAVESDRTMAAGPQTVAGMIVGTFNYMSPEQAQGQKVDWRSDIFAFGILLYEMATGKNPFDAATPVGTLASIVGKEPPVASDIVPMIPPALAHLIARCLRKEPERRAQHMDDLKVALEEIEAERMPGWTSSIVAAPPIPPPTPSVIVAPQPPEPPATRRRWKAWWIGAGAVALAVAALAALWDRREKLAAEPLLSRLTAESGLTAYPALSRDGKLLAYASDRAGEGNLDIWLQQIGGGTPIRRTRDEADEFEPEFSADGTKIVYYSAKAGGGIYLLPALEGAPRQVAPGGHRPRLSPDGQQVAYWTGFPGPGFLQGSMKVFVAPVAGGPARQIGTEFWSIRNPVWLADGKRVLVVGRQETRESMDWWVVPVEGGTPIRTGAFALFQSSGLTPAALDHALVPEAMTPDGERVLFSATLRDTTNVWQVRLDPNSGKVTGRPERLTLGTDIEAHASAAGAAGNPLAALAYAALSLNVDVWSLPVDVNRGKPTGAVQPVTRGLTLDAWPSVTPEGRRLVYASRQSDQGTAVMKDLVSGAETNLTGPLKGELQPKISADGKRVAYSDSLTKTGYVVGAEGGLAEKLCDNCILPTHWTHSGRRILFESGAQPEALVLVEPGTGKRVPLVSHSKSILNAGRFSPDDRWVAFHLRNNPLTRQIFVAQLDGDSLIPESSWLPVTDGKTMDREAVWSPDGNLLYFLSDRDGFRCIWAQRLDGATRKPLGESFAVQHFHNARRSMTAVGPNVGAVGLSVAKDQLVFALGELTGNIWTREAGPR